MISVEHYNLNRGIYSPVIEHNGIVAGMWMAGNDYRNKSKYFGAYPPSYLKRIHLLFPEVQRVLHIFSGKVETGLWPGELTIDINPDLNPGITGNVEKLSTLLPEHLIGSIELILADPPYGNNHLKYDTPRVNKKQVIRECSMVLEPGGHLVWLDVMIPMWAKADGWKMRGTVGFVQSTQHQVRIVTILEKAT